MALNLFAIWAMLSECKQTLVKPVILLLYGKVIILEIF